MSKFGRELEQIGELMQPHSLSGRNCTDVYNASVECRGHWCIRSCGNTECNYTIPETDIDICESLSRSLVSERGTGTARIANCWGCISRVGRHAPLCVSLPYNGFRACSCLQVRAPSSTCTSRIEDPALNRTWYCGALDQEAQNRIAWVFRTDLKPA